MPFSFVIPANSTFTVRGITNAGAGQRFDLHVPARAGASGDILPPQDFTVTGGGYPYNKPMSPDSIVLETRTMLPIIIQFYKHLGGADWQAREEFRQRSQSANNVVVGFDDTQTGPARGYNNIVVTISWGAITFSGRPHPDFDRLRGDAISSDVRKMSPIDLVRGNEENLSRLQDFDRRLRVMESMIGLMFDRDLKSASDKHNAEAESDTTTSETE